MYELRQLPEECLDARYTDLQTVYRERCHEMGGNQKFIYKEVIMISFCFCFLNNKYLNEFLNLRILS